MYKASKIIYRARKVMTTMIESDEGVYIENKLNYSET